MLSIKTQLLTILRHFEVCTDTKLKDIHLTFDMMLRNVKGYEMYLKKRNNWNESVKLKLLANTIEMNLW